MKSSLDVPSAFSTGALGERSMREMRSRLTGVSSGNSSSLLQAVKSHGCQPQTGGGGQTLQAQKYVIGLLSHRCFCLFPRYWRLEIAPSGVLLNVVFFQLAHLWQGHAEAIVVVGDGNRLCIVVNIECRAGKSRLQACKV